MHSLHLQHSLPPVPMPKCFFSFTAAKDWFYRYSFSNAGLKSTLTDLKDGTIMHCWVAKTHNESKPTLVLIHGFGSGAMWQWNDFISPLVQHFNIYVPDLVFFGDSYTSRPERSESFQAQCVMGLMEAHGISKMFVAGISYGGFVAYRMAVLFPERIEKLVLFCAGVCLEDKDMVEGMFKVKSVDEAASILLPQTPDKMRELMCLAFVKPPKRVPSCFYQDYIDEVCMKCLQEKKELIQALHKDRKFSDLPKIDKPTLICWGEQDQVFPLELAYRLKRHIGENAELVVMKDAGHALNVEKPRELCKHLKSFLVHQLPPSQQMNHDNGVKQD